MTLTKVLDISQAKKGVVKKKKRKNEYIPGLAAFYFKPQYDWTREEAEDLYLKQQFTEYNQIFYEDCVEGMKRLPSESIDLVIADPPFGLDFNGKESIYNRNSEYVQDDYEEIKKSEYERFTRNWIMELRRLMKDTASVFIFSGWTNLKDVLIAIDESSLHVLNHLVWEYQFGVFTKKKHVSSHYHILWAVKDPQRYFFHKIEHYPLDVWDIPRTYKRGEKKNGTKLPLQLITRCINFCSKPGDLILDPFLGNGTTAISAKGSFRHYIGFEINTRMKSIIDGSLAEIEPGDFYIPYSELCKPDIEKLKKEYPKAYKIYLKRKKKK